MLKFIRSLEDFLSWLGRITAWFVPLLVLCVCVTVAMVQLGWNHIFVWDFSIPLFGESLSLSGLTELQWHLFAAFTMLGSVYALHDNAHVSVDFISSKFSQKTNSVILILGDLCLLLPFASIMAYYGWIYTVSSYNFMEGSSYGGLLDRWIVKSMLPIGFGMLALFALLRAIRTTAQLFSKLTINSIEPEEAN